MKCQLLALIALFFPFANHCMDSETETTSKKAHQEVLVTFITADNQTFNVPVSFINTSKTFKQISRSKLAVLESATESTNKAYSSDTNPQIALSSSLITSDVWRIIEPHYDILSRLHLLKKEMRKLIQELTYVNGFGIYREELSESRNSELKQKYPHLKSVPYKEVIEMLNKIRQKIGVLRKERAEIYTTLYFAFKKLEQQEFIALILLQDFCQMRCLRSVLLSLALHIPGETTSLDPEQYCLPESFLEDVARKREGTRKSLLHWASSRGMLSVVEDLVVNEKAHLEERNSRGNTPLNYAAEQGNAEIVEFLLLKGASTCIHNHSGLNPLQSSCSSKNVEAIRHLLGKGLFQLLNGNGTAFHLACSSKECAELVYEYYSPGVQNLLERKNSFGNTPLLEACQRQSDESVRYLLEKGANVRATNNIQRTALHIACDSTNYDLVVALVEAGAPLNAVEANQCTPLHIACMFHDNSIIVQYLANREGIDLGLTDKNGQTPLQIAANWNNLKVVKFLMEDCQRGFDDLKNQDLDSYKEKVASYLKQRKTLLAKRAQEEKDERARLLARAQKK